jgi:hypothetical protein
MHHYNNMIRALSFILLLVPGFAHAQGGVLENPLKSDSIEALLLVFVNGVIQLGAIVVVLALVWAGFQFVAAQGNQEKLQGARMTLMWTIVGAAILLGAKVIVEVIGATVESI